MDLSNLISHWKMDDATVGVRLDSHGIHGLSVGGGVTQVAGKIGNAAHFSGTSQYLYDFSVFSVGDVDFEINGWVNFDSLTAGMAVVFCGGFAIKSYKLYTDGTYLRFTVSADGASWTTEVASPTVIAPGSWYFFRCWHDSVNNQIAIQINLEAAVTAAHSTGVHSDIFPNNYLLVARHLDTFVAGAELKGSVDSLSFWTRILTDSESQCVYNGGSGLDYPWPCVTAGVAAISFFDAINRPTATPIVLVEQTVGIWCRNWVVDATYTNTYKVNIQKQNAFGDTFSLNITSVQWNLTTELTEKTSAALVNANAGTWFCDGAYLWVRPVSGSIFDNTVQAFATFYFSQLGRVLNNIFWEPRISAVPSLSQRIEANFGGVGQIGGGSITLFNHDGYFNQMQDFQWHHGQVTIKLGIDVPQGQVMNWQDYQTIATWSVKDWKRDETNFTLTLIEPKSNVKTKLPFTFFNRTDYPNIEDNIVGKPIPLAYGQLYGISPILISPGTKTFKVAGHAIKSFDGVRIKKDREETRTITTAVGDWQRYSGTVYRYYLSGEQARNVAFNAASLTSKNSVDDVVSTTGTWAISENFVYVNPSSGQTIDSGTYTIVAFKTVQGFVTSNFASVDTANAQFTLGNDWAVGTEVSVDFRGKANSDGTLMDNAADIILDLLTAVGETDIDSASFNTARLRFIVGTSENGESVTRMKPSVYVDEATQVLDIISAINELAGCFLYSDELGRFHIGAWTPQPGESLTIFTDLDLLDFEELTDAEETFSKYVTSYQNRKEDAFAQVDTVENTANQYIAGQPQPVVNEQTIELADATDADDWTRRQLIMRGLPLKKYTFTLPWNALLKKPGDQVHIQSDQRQIDDVMEILEVRRDLGTKQVTLVIGNLRNFADTPGFWIDSTAVLPTRFSALSGYGVGALDWNSAWDSTIKKWARQNVGYWVDSNGFAATADPDSFLPSVWI